MASAQVIRRLSVQLARQASLAGRWPVLVEDDLAAIDPVTGSRAASFAVLRRLAEIGQLEPVRRGTYVMRDETGVLRVDLLSLIDAVTPAPYLITAGRALAAHDLSDPHFRTAIVLVPRPRRPFTWRGDRVRYVVAPADRIWGARRSGPRLAAPERAILDSIAHPRWGVTFSQAAEALRLALDRSPRFAARLATATRRYRNAATARRLGFLVEQIAGPDAAAPFRALRGSSRAATLLDPAGSRTGPYEPRWRVRVNADLDAVLATPAVR
jgi:predicted transcriptional regulator of viral defense system